jgi:demethylmenaquinone methyltransferase/2-methoxy-6-polyprenyl-1,4-benzoquinol methylase
MIMSAKLAPISGAMLTSAPDKLRYNQKLFSIVAPQYRRATVALSFGRDASWKRKLVTCLPGLESGIIVDIACGTGDITALLCKKYSGCRVVGIDVSPAMLAQGQAQGNIATAAIHDMAALGLRDAACDIVTGCYALRNAPDIQCTLREIRRVLKDDGTAALLDFSRSENRAIAAIHYLLLGFWGSVWGMLLHGNPAVYAYIARSLMHFPRRGELRRNLNAAGLTVTRSRLFFGGMLELIICRPNLRPRTIA